MHITVCVYTCMYSLNKGMLLDLTMLPTRAQTNKYPSTRHKKPFQLLVKVLPVSQNNINYCYCPWLTLRGWQ